jgi:hypothetical protein
MIFVTMKSGCGVVRIVCFSVHLSKPEARTSSGRAGVVGMLQAILQVMLQGPRSWVLCLLLDGRFVPGLSFLGPRSWVLCLLLAGRFVPRSSFLSVMLVT